MKCFVRVVLVCVAMVGGARNVIAADRAADLAAIEKAIESYTIAFNAGDSKLLAAHWAPEAVYTNPLTGNQVVGREAIANEFKDIFADLKDIKLTVDVESIRFISPSVAVEQGVATLLSTDGQPQGNSYTAIHVKRNGKWLLDRVTEEEVPVVPSHYDQLKDLEWMIGTWLDSAENDQIETTCQWARNNNFIIRSFKVSVQDRIDMSGLQIIGWDPAAGKIRSWAFDSDGGFAEGTWTKKDDRWVVESNATLPDGKKGSSINIMTVVDANTFRWQATGREVDGTILPNIDEIKVTRVAVPE